MCLILLAISACEDYPLVVAANRDEFFARPTAPAAFWAGTDLLAGRDLRQGGSWFGVTRRMRLAMVTNVREPRVEVSGASRGHLVRDYLLAAMPPELFMAYLEDQADHYPGFNMVFGTFDELWFASNRSVGRGPLPAGIHGLSNASLNTPWPKVEQGRAELQAILASPGDHLPERIFALLADPTPAADEQLPETGVSLEWERALSARFIRRPDYGTRTSTVLLVNRQRQGQLIERSFTAAGTCYNEQVFSLPGPMC